MRLSEHIVNKLLEAIRACAHCQKEFGVRPEPGTSHGICRRHALAQYQEMIDVYGDDPEIQRLVQDIKQRPEDSFAPDLAQQQQ